MQPGRSTPPSITVRVDELWKLLGSPCPSQHADPAEGAASNPHRLAEGTGQPHGTGIATAFLQALADHQAQLLHTGASSIQRGATSGVTEEGRLLWQHVAGAALQHSTALAAFLLELLRVRGVLADTLQQLWEEVVAAAHTVAQAEQAASKQQQASVQARPTSPPPPPPKVLQQQAEAVAAVFGICDAAGDKLALLEQQLGSAVRSFQEVGSAMDEAAATTNGTAANGCEERVQPVQPKSEGSRTSSQGLCDLIPEVLLAGMTPDAVLVGLSDVYARARHLLDRTTLQLSALANGPLGACAGAGVDGQGAPSQKSPGSPKVKEWKPPDQFRRSTTKFWVRTCDIPRLRSALIRHLPVLMLGRVEGALVQECAGRLAAANRPSLRAFCTSLPSRTASSAITSVYLDSLTGPHPSAQASNSSSSSSRYGPGSGSLGRGGDSLWPWAPGDRTVESCVLGGPLPVYHWRLRREDRSSLLRIRWYGDHVPGSDMPGGASGAPAPGTGTGPTAYLERKLHRESWTGEMSVKERVALPLASVPCLLGGAVPDLDQNTAGSAYAKGTKQPQGPSAASDESPDRPTPCIAKSLRQRRFLTEVVAFIQTLGQAPLMRTRYQRTAFQLSSTNAVRVSLDTQVVMGREAGDWVGDPLRAPNDAPSQEVSFPYAILEIKLLDGDSCPDWVLELQRSGLLVEVPKFSKFLHGVALLYPDVVRNTPYWFLPTYPLADAPEGVHSPSSSGRSSGHSSGSRSGATGCTVYEEEEEEEGCTHASHGSVDSCSSSNASESAKAAGASAPAPAGHTPLLAQGPQPAQPGLLGPCPTPQRAATIPCRRGGGSGDIGAIHVARGPSGPLSRLLSSCPRSISAASVLDTSIVEGAVAAEDGGSQSAGEGVNNHPKSQNRAGSSPEQHKGSGKRPQVDPRSQGEHQGRRHSQGSWWQRLTSRGSSGVPSPPVMTPATIEEVAASHEWAEKAPGSIMTPPDIPLALLRNVRPVSGALPALSGPQSPDGSGIQAAWSSVAAALQSASMLRVPSRDSAQVIGTQQSLTAAAAAAAAEAPPPTRPSTKLDLSALSPTADTEPGQASGGGAAPNDEGGSVVLNWWATAKAARQQPGNVDVLAGKAVDLGGSQDTTCALARADNGAQEQDSGEQEGQVHNGVETGEEDGHRQSAAHRSDTLFSHPPSSSVLSLSEWHDQCLQHPSGGPNGACKHPCTETDEVSGSDGDEDDHPPGQEQQGLQAEHSSHTEQDREEKCDVYVQVVLTIVTECGEDSAGSLDPARLVNVQLLVVPSADSNGSPISQSSVGVVSPAAMSSTSRVRSHTRSHSHSCSADSADSVDKLGGASVAAGGATTRPPATSPGPSSDRHSEPDLGASARAAQAASQLQWQRSNSGDGANVTSTGSPAGWGASDGATSRGRQVQATGDDRMGCFGCRAPARASFPLVPPPSPAEHRGRPGTPSPSRSSGRGYASSSGSTHVFDPTAWPDQLHSAPLAAACRLPASCKRSGGHWVAPLPAVAAAAVERPALADDPTRVLPAPHVALLMPSKADHADGEHKGGGDDDDEPTSPGSSTEGQKTGSGKRGPSVWGRKLLGRLRGGAGIGASSSNGVGTEASGRGLSKEHLPPARKGWRRLLGRSSSRPRLLPVPCKGHAVPPGDGRSGSDQWDMEAGGGGGPGPRVQAMVRSRVEPKTFFAAERTFLSWLQLAVLLMFVSLSLMAGQTPVNGGGLSMTVPGAGPGGLQGSLTPASAQEAGANGSTGTAGSGGGGGDHGLFKGCFAGDHGSCHAGLIAGLVVAPATLCLMGYSLFMYRSRTAQILRRESARFDDQRGPIIVVIMLMAVLALAYAMAVIGASK